jgi:hypothetical protein
MPKAVFPRAAAKIKPPPPIAYTRPARSSTLNFQLSTVNFFPKKKSGRWGDRPLGRGGWRVLQPEASPFPPQFRCAREQQNEIQEQSGPSLSAPEAVTNSRLHLRFCSPPPCASIARQVHSSQYFPLLLIGSFWYLCTFASSSLSRSNRAFPMAFQRITIRTAKDSKAAAPERSSARPIARA